MSEEPQEEEDQEGLNIVYSPTNSATTGFSGATSLSLHYKGSWCTPPRIFVDQVTLNGSDWFQILGSLARKIAYCLFNDESMMGNPRGTLF